VEHNNDEVDLTVAILREKMVLPADFEDIAGITREIPLATRRAVVRALGFPDHRMPAYATNWPDALLKTPRRTRCFLADDFQSQRLWGISTQIYELRSHRNWGIGDLEDVKNLCTIAAVSGADFVGLNPLHALFLSEPSRCSPYSPSNRGFLNPLYLAVDQVFGFDDKAVEYDRLVELRSGELVDYAGVTLLKLEVLKTLWTSWKTERFENRDGAKQAFDVFKKDGGEALFSHCLFETLSAEMTRRGFECGWHGWPPDYQNRQSRVVGDFAVAHADEINFYAWLQWLTNLQLEDVAAYARSLMRIGLYLDRSPMDHRPGLLRTLSCPG